MGSLMAGWHSPTLDPESASTKRNRSLTKEQINAYWRTQKKTESEHIRAISELSETIQTPKFEDSENSGVSSTVTLNRTKEPLDMDGDEKSLKKFVKKNCWWTKSSLAFLNEPPVIEASSNNYGSQFDVLRSTKFKTENEIGA